MRRLKTAARNTVAVASLAVSGTAPVLAEQFDSSRFGTAADAQAMLERAVVAMKQDQAGTIKRLLAKDPAFNEKDLYVTCANVGDGDFTYHPTLMGKMTMRNSVDAFGKKFGLEIFAKAKPDEISKVTYMWPRPDQTTPSLKLAYVTQVTDQVCMVGFYR